MLRKKLLIAGLVVTLAAMTAGCTAKAEEAPEATEVEATELTEAEEVEATEETATERSNRRS